MDIQKTTKPARPDGYYRVRINGNWMIGLYEYKMEQLTGGGWTLPWGSDNEPEPDSIFEEISDIQIVAIPPTDEDILKNFQPSENYQIQQLQAALEKAQSDKVGWHTEYIAMQSAKGKVDMELEEVKAELKELQKKATQLRGAAFGASRKKRS